MIRDGDVFRMFYRGWSEGGSGVLCYAESRDGVRWEKPNLRLVEVGGTRENNVVALVDGTGRRPVRYLFPFIDSRPGVPASERVKGIRAILQSKEPFLMHVYLYGSKDWFQWRRLRKEPIIASGIPNAFDPPTTSSGPRRRDSTSATSATWPGGPPALPRQDSDPFSEPPPGI